MKNGLAAISISLDTAAEFWASAQTLFDSHGQAAMLGVAVRRVRVEASRRSTARDVVNASVAA